MTWATQGNGAPPLFPYLLAARLVKLGREDVNELVSVARKLYEVACQLDMTVRTLQAENLRLKHENAFMLALINQHLPPDQE